MADDPSQRFYHPDDPPGRGASAGSPEPRSGSDPLAELARLIGQNDPFGEFGREGARRSMPPHPKPATDWRPHPEDLSYAPPTAAREPDHYHTEQPEYAEAETQTYEASRYYASDINQDGEPEDVYDDAQARRRRTGVIAIAAVFALAVIGTAGAFTYRAIYHTGATKPPPVIKADTTPSKVVPDIKSKDPQSAKLIYDRVNDRAQPERIVSREEHPVEMRDKPAGVLPPGQNENATMLGSGVVGAEPKKIHTIAIRPEHGGTASIARRRRRRRTQTPLRSLRSSLSRPRRSRWRQRRRQRGARRHRPRRARRCRSTPMRRPPHRRGPRRHPRVPLR